MAENSSVTVVTDQNFESIVIASSIPVLCFFWAIWAAPCREMEPEIEALVPEYAGRALMTKIDVDNCPDIAEQYNITNVPTTIIFQNGKPVETFPTIEPKQVLEKALDKYVSPPS